MLRDFKKDLKFSFGHVKMIASNTHLGTSSTRKSDGDGESSGWRWQWKPAKAMWWSAGMEGAQGEGSTGSPHSRMKARKGGSQ